MHFKTYFEMWEIQAYPVPQITKKVSLDSLETGYSVEKDRGL